MTSPSRSELLRSIPLFSKLTDADRTHLASRLVTTQHRKGDYIFREGDPADCFHIVLDGSVKCTKSSAAGKEVTLKVLMPGDLFCCEAAVFDGGVHPGCALSTGDITVLRLPKEALLEVLRRNPEAALEVIRYLGRRLTDAQENAKMLALEGAEQRLAALLVDLAARAGSATKPASASTSA